MGAGLYELMGMRVAESPVVSHSSAVGYTFLQTLEKLEYSNYNLWRETTIGTK